MLNSLPPMRTKLVTVTEDFILSVVCVHTICKAELDEEWYTTKALQSKKISREICVFVLSFCCSIIVLTHLFAYTSLYPYLDQDSEMKQP
jgi:hypothetical protein